MCGGFVRDLMKREKKCLFKFILNRSLHPADNVAEKNMVSVVKYMNISDRKRIEKGAGGLT